MRKLIIIVTVAISSMTVMAGDSDSTHYPLKIVPLPSIGYAPETKLTFGAAVLGQFKLSGSGIETRSSNIIAFVTYTLNRQYKIKAEQTVFFPQEKYLWIGELEFVRFPESFWGIGSDSSDEDEVNVDHRSIIVQRKYIQEIRLTSVYWSESPFCSSV